MPIENLYMLQAHTATYIFHCAFDLYTTVQSYEIFRNTKKHTIIIIMSILISRCLTSPIWHRITMYLMLHSQHNTTYTEHICQSQTLRVNYVVEFCKRAESHWILGRTRYVVRYAKQINPHPNENIHKTIMI